MSQNMAVLVPSRGRPDNIGRLLDTWVATAATSRLIIVLDNDDEKLSEYLKVIEAAETDASLVTTRVGERERLGPTLNREAPTLVHEWPYIGFMGDDHVPRTMFWDEHICDHLCDLTTGIVYGNDLFQGPNLPTAVFMTSDIPKTLGYFCPPGLIHLYLDNSWMAWGNGISRLRYLDNIIIEHMHPHAFRKAEWDDRYAEVNSEEMYTHDAAVFSDYQATGKLADDLTKLGELL